MWDVCCATAGWGPESTVTVKGALVGPGQGAGRRAKPDGSVASNLVCVVGSSPLEGAWPCLTSSELLGQIECASVASPTVDIELSGKEGVRRGRRREDGAT